VRVATPEFAMDQTLLIVDDEEMVRRALTRTLRADGYRLLTAASGEEALALLERQPVTMVISDQHMGAMSGLELLRSVSERWPETLRIVLTGHADLLMALEGINHCGLYGFLTKPWEDLGLRHMVRLGFERHALTQENSQLRDTVKAHERILDRLEAEHPGIASVRRDASGAVVVDDE
jgi:two-component system probable response regulator PhcQ